MNNTIRSADRIHRRGLSLLEVIIALAILGLGLATIGELIRIGTDSAKRARQQTTAQLLCQGRDAAEQAIDDRASAVEFGEDGVGIDDEGIDLLAASGEYPGHPFRCRQQ